MATRPADWLKVNHGVLSGLCYDLAKMHDGYVIGHLMDSGFGERALLRLGCSLLFLSHAWRVILPARKLLCRMIWDASSAEAALSFLNHSMLSFFLPFSAHTSFPGTEAHRTKQSPHQTVPPHRDNPPASGRAAPIKPKAATLLSRHSDALLSFLSGSQHQYFVPSSPPMLCMRTSLLRLGADTTGWSARGLTRILRLWTKCLRAHARDVLVGGYRFC